MRDIPDLSEAPEPICRLIDWLVGNGLQVTYERADGAFNQFARWENDCLRLEMTADRGEWSVAIGTPDMSETFHPDQFEAWIGDFPLVGDLSALYHQVDFITARWPQIGAAVRKAPRAEEEIREIGRDYVRRRFGETRG